MLLPIEVRDRNYREVQFIFARELPAALREQAARAYETMFIATANLAAMRERGGGTSDEVKTVQRIGEQMGQANQALHEYLTTILKAERLTEARNMACRAPPRPRSMFLAKIGRTSSLLERRVNLSR